MKKIFLPLVFVGAALASTESFAQATLYGRPASASGGTITCGLNDGTCAQIGGGEVSDAKQRQDEGVTVTVFTEDGPVTFKAEPDYQIIGSPKGGATLVVQEKEEIEKKEDLFIEQ